MNTKRTVVSRLRCSPIRRGAVVLLVALAGSRLVFGGEIHDAATKGDLNKVKTLLKGKPSLLSSRDDKTGRTALHLASYYNRKSVVEFLLANKADVNAKANDGRTPLHDAVLLGGKAVVELLLANKANVNVKANDGQTPLQYSVTMRRKDVSELLRQHGARE
jgi:ankyrin repeat protein